MRRVALILAAFGLYASAAWGQEVGPSPTAASIDCPSEVDVYKLISAKLNVQLEDGVYFADGGWEIAGENGDQISDSREFVTELLWTAPPGKYRVSFDAVKLKDVTFVDGNGNTITIVSYLGKIKGSVVCTVKGSPVPPPPPPPPPPPVKGKVVVVEENSPGNPQRALWVALRKKYPGSNFQVYDQDHLPQSYVKLKSLVNGKKLPQMFVLTESGDVFHQGDGPSSVGDVDAWLIPKGGS